MDTNLECCVLGCHSRPNQGLRFYRFPCHNLQISSIWEQRLCQSANIDFDILNDHVCELHFDYRCKTGNECALEDSSLPTLNLPGGTIFSAAANKIEQPSYTVSIDALSYHCRICLRRGLLYEFEASTYRSKSLLSLIDLPQNVLPNNIQPNACLSCLKSIVIAHQLSMAVEQSNTILQLLLEHPKQSKVVSNTFFDIKSELAFCNLIPANLLSIKLEIEVEDNMVLTNDDYEEKWYATGEPTFPAFYVNTQNMIEKSICVAETQDNFNNLHDSVTPDNHCLASRDMTDVSAEGISFASEHSYSCVLVENTEGNAEIVVSNNSDDAENRQFDNQQAPESTSKGVNEATYKYDLCKFTTNYKANLAIHNKLHLARKDKVHFYCQKCEKDFLLRCHFVRHNAIVHIDDFICKICDKPHASAIKLAVHWTEHHHFQRNISSGVLRNGLRAHMLDIKQGQTIFTTINKSTYWTENDGVYVCPICDWKCPSFHTFNAHVGKHKVQSGKNSAGGSEELETLETDHIRNADGRHQCTECPRSFSRKIYFSVHKRIHTNERPYKCTECPKTFNQKGSLIRHIRIHTNERPYKCTECPTTFSQKGNLYAHKKVHTNKRPYKCTECPKNFNHKGSLIRHKRIHTNERPYKCSECPTTFSQKGNFDIHQRIHTNERPYKCIECPKTFSDNSNFIAHRRIHANEKPYKCTDCSKTFGVKSVLIRHKRIHTNERPYKCTDCSKTFSHKSSLDRHKIIHTNERPYKCTECPKAFNNKSDSIRHKRIHKNERIYNCAECSKTFSRKINLNIHKRIHTNEISYK